MKTKYRLQILSLLFIVGMAACSQEEVNPTPVEESKEYKVSLNFNGEITASDAPLSRGTATNDLIGVQVYQDGTKYAHGLFDNVEDININLHSDSKYKFVVTVVKDGKAKISHGSLDSGFKNSGYNYPFISYRSYWLNKSSESFWGYVSTNVRNQFIFEFASNGYEYNALESGKASTTEDQGLSNYPPVDRFYGEIDNYSPTPNGTVAIELKRTSFGLKYEVNGVTDGTVTVKINNSSRTFFENSAITTDYESEGKIFTFFDVYNAWKNADNYEETVTVSASWTRLGIKESLGSKNVQIKRNVMNIIRLNLSSVDYNGTIGIDIEEETGMNEESVIGALDYKK